MLVAWHPLTATTQDILLSKLFGCRSQHSIILNRYFISIYLVSQFRNKWWRQWSASASAQSITIRTQTKGLKRSDARRRLAWLHQCCIAEQRRSRKPIRGGGGGGEVQKAGLGWKLHPNESSALGPTGARSLCGGPRLSPPALCCSPRGRH